MEPKWPPRGVEEEASKIITISVKMLDFDGRGWLKIGKICFQSGFERKKSSNRSKKIVAKGLRETIWTKKGASISRAPCGRGPGRRVGGMDKSIPD